MTESKICTCPSGDGSLRWPCPKHPAVEQAGGDERVIGWRERILAAHPNSDPGFWPDALLVEHMAAEIADLRAALAQPSLTLPPFAEKVLAKLRRFNECAVCVDSGKVYDISGEGPWKCYACTGSHEVIGYANGDELDNMLDDRTAVLSPVKTSFHTVPVYREARAALAQPSDEVVVTKNESGAIVSVTRQDKEGRVLSVIAESQPSPAQAEQAEAERPEVVAWSAERYVAGDHYSKPRLSFEQPYSTDRNVEALMTVAQHDRIVGELRADRDSWAEQAEQRLADWDEMRKERDAALAEVAGLRSLLNSLLCYVERDINRMRSDRDKSDNKEIYDRSISLAMERLKAAQNAVFTTEPGCDTAVELAAQTTQAQHSVPEEFSFEYRHPNGESHTVTVSRDQVINEMPDFLFEALCSKLCNCEPAGETNVVECCCDEYAEEFKLLAAAPGKEGV